MLALTGRARRPHPRRPRRSLAAVLLLAALAALVAAPAAAQDEAVQSGAAPVTKLRLLVDKVLMAEGDTWVMTEDHVRQIAAAGFNAVSPRRGGDDLAEVRRVTALADRYGMRHLPWLRGTLVAPEGEAAAGQRMVWANGAEQDLYSPNAPQLWSWLTDRIVGYAELSAEMPALMGVFMDFENYAPKAQADAYGLSYDAQTLKAFGRAYALKIPELAPDQRRAWLVAEGRHEAFEAFQVEQWRRRCRRLRQAVDRINPAFQFCLHPAPGTPFIERAAWREWATEAAPLILADSKTYSRPSALLGHADALAANRRRIEGRRERVSGAAGPVWYLGGINPLFRGADPEYSGKNAVMLADAVDGYWVFYEGVASDAAHAEYFEWFTWANQAIAAGRFAAQSEPRRTPEPGPATAVVEPSSGRPQLAAYRLNQRMMHLLADENTFEVHDLRGLSASYLEQIDVVILQNFNVELDYSDAWVQALRGYVSRGGGLMIAHDTGWYMASPAPEIAVRDYPTRRVESVRHVVETDLEVVSSHPALGSLEGGVTFSPDFRDHMIFRPGPRGRVVIANALGDPVYVVGQLGAGRVAYTGSYYGYSRVPQGPEREAFLGCIRWLAGG